jgi:2-dehydro-3-deoxyphosphogluconate aldolase / (4S)-4-hydroxy-2-oxoglutarate aldolase
MDTPGAVEVLESLRSRVPANALLGAGTVTDVAGAEAALAAGASFIVTPNIDLEVIRTVRAHGIPVMPGALSPTEIWTAMKAGADFVKVFPASAVGPGYFRELRGPFEKIPLMHHSVQRGDAIRILQESGSVRSVQLTENYRAKTSHRRSAVYDLKARKLEEGWETLDQAGAIIEIEDPIQS